MAHQLVAAPQLIGDWYVRNIYLVNSRAFRYRSVNTLYRRGRSIYIKGYSRIDLIRRYLCAVYIDLKDLSTKGRTVGVTVVLRGGKAI